MFGDIRSDGHRSRGRPGHQASGNPGRGPGLLTHETWVRRISGKTHSNGLGEAVTEAVHRSHHALCSHQQNVSSSFDLAKSLATAKTLAEIVELRATYWRKQLSALADQAEEVRALSTKVAADMAAPTHVTRSLDELREAK